MSNFRNSPSSFIPSLLIAMLPIAVFLAFYSSSQVYAAVDFDFVLLSSEVDEKVGYLGDVTRFTFQLTNNTDGELPMTLSATSSAGFNVDFSPSSPISLSANADIEVIATVSIPSSATEATVDIVVSATDGAETEDVTVKVVVLEEGDIGVRLVGGLDKTGSGGQTVELDFTIENDAANNDSTYAADFTVIASSQRGYSLEIVTESDGSQTGTGVVTEVVQNLAAGNGNTQDIKVRVTLPSAATGRDTITVEALSVIDSDIADSDSADVIISNPTSTPTSAPVTYADDYEPNDSLQTATDISTSGTEQCDHTFWPVGDKDYFKFATTAGLQYVIETTRLDDGIDPFMQLFDPRGNPGVTNDNLEPGNLNARIGFIAGETSFTYFSVANVSPLDSTGKEYCVKVKETLVTPTVTPTPTKTPTNTLTATPTPTITPTATLLGDNCEPNENAQQACSILPGEQVTGDFANPFGTVTDQDFYKLLSVKRNVIYTCSTSDLAPGVDTRLELRNQRFEWLGDNDDKEPNNPGSGSEVTIQARESGIIYVIVRPFTAPPVDEAELYTYKLACVAIVPTATPLPTETPTPTITPTPTETPLPPPTNTPVPSWTPSPITTVGPTSAPATATATQRPVINTPRPVSTATPLTPTQTPLPTPTPFVFVPPTPTPTPRVVVNPIPTVTPAVTTPTNVSLDVLLYYDINGNFTPEANEGIMDVAVAIYDNATGELLSFGTTNANGMVTFPNLEPTGNALRISIPFLNFNQVVAASVGTLQIRISPQQLPNFIP